MLISLVKSRLFSLAGSGVVLLLAGVVLNGCASSPDFSRMAPSHWPGAKQVAGTGRAIGGWVAKKAKLRPEEPRLPKSVVSRRDPGPVIPGGQSSGNLRSFFAGTNDSEPTDPFLAQLTQDQTTVESASHTNPAPSSDITANTEREPTFKPAAHSFDGPPVKKPQPRIPIIDEGAPFADLAGTDPTRTANKAVESETARFAAGIDQQLAQLREEAAVPQASDEGIADDNPLRTAILGARDDISSENVVDLPSEAELPVADVVAPADVMPDDVPFRVTERTMKETETVIDELLPEWARGELPGPKVSEPIVDADEEPLVTDVPLEPTPKEPTSPFSESPAENSINESPAEDLIRVAVVEDEPKPKPDPEPVAKPIADVDAPAETTPKAIEIVPFRPNEFVETPDVAESDAAKQVEILPPPPESVPDFGADEHRDDAAGISDDMPSFSGMIVESDGLPTGFAEWEGPDSTATVRTNSPVEAEPASVVRRGEVTARLAMNSRQSLVDSSANSYRGEFVGSESHDRQSRTLQDNADSNPFALETVNDSETVNDQFAEPRLFAPTAGGVQVAESSLETIEWDPETEPGVEPESSLFSSTAIVGLLIGLVCLIGLGTIRRIQSAV